MVFRDIEEEDNLMSNNPTNWSEFIPLLRSRGVDEALGSVFFRNAPLNQWLRETLGAKGPDARFPLLGEPLFEAVFPWKLSGKNPAALVKEGLLHQETVDAAGLNPPYTHQYEVFKQLLSDPHASVLVSSGTGSGKTECFMVPILESVVREIKAERNVPGIRALFLYPLNALIANQKKRLNQYTGPFNGAVRYALYTGELEEEAPRKRTADINPGELNSRKVMREKIPHLLVTNPTMLEYMLLREADAGMIAKTRQNRSFKWIVLDEAHTYIGSRAAEMALLLRRVLNAFDVSPNDVHFIATTATVDAGNLEKLRKFLVDLSGADPKNIHLFFGQRDVPPTVSETELKDTVTLAELQNLAQTASDEELAQSLKKSGKAMRIRNAFIGRGYLKLGEIQKLIGGDEAEALGWVDVLTKPAGKQVLLPLRLQQMMSTTDFLNVCPDSNCKAKEGALKDPAWKFGAVWLDGRRTCTCGAPLFPLVACSRCSTVSLSAGMKVGMDGKYRFVRPDDEQESAEGWTEYERRGISDLVEATGDVDSEAKDAAAAEERTARDEEREKAAAQAEKTSEDFDDSMRLDPPAGDLERSTAADGQDSFDDGGNPDDQEDSDLVTPVFITNERSAKDTSCNLEWVHVDELTKKSESRSAVITVRNADEAGHIDCPGCGESLRRKDFYMRRISERYSHALVPLILDYSGQTDAKLVDRRPMDGHKLLSFTDSRQGTAKAGALIEREGERSLLSSTLFSTLVAADDGNVCEAAGVDSFISAMKESAAKEKWSEQLQALLDNTLRSLPKENSGLAWSAFEQKLENHFVEKEPFQTYKALSASFRIASERLSPREMAKILLLREFASRPVNGVTLETCGLIRLDYPKLSRETEAPSDWPLNLQDWRNYLKIVLDFFVRLNHGVALPASWKKFSGNSRVFGRRILPPDRRQGSYQGIKWPSVSKNPEQSSRIVKFTARVLGIDLDQKLKRHDIERVNDILKVAFTRLTALQILTADEMATGSGYRLRLEDNVEFSLNRSAWRFEGINKLFDTIVGSEKDAVCPTHIKVIGAHKEPVPEPPEADFEADKLKAKHEIRTFLTTSPEFRRLADAGCWNTSGTYAFERNGYFSGAEHTAQLDKYDRSMHETDFEQGYINVLASSTTMEMGIDLGDIGAVVLNGVPPHPANYLQRIGRAGRRGETRVNALAFCRSSARDRQVFTHVDWALKEKQPELSVALNSVSIVERHVTAEILSHYFHSKKNLEPKISVEAWINRYSRDFAEWLSKLLKTSDPVLAGRIAQVVKFSVLESRRFAAHLEAAGKAVSRVIDRDRAEIERYDRLIRDKDENSVFRKALQRRRNTIASEDVLKRLTECLVLPSSIRVVNTVQLERPVDETGKTLADGRTDLNAGITSREGKTGIYEYAPGASVIIDGTKCVVNGIRVTWPVPNGENEKQSSLPNKVELQCRHCKTRFLTEMGSEENLCPTCGSVDAEILGKAFLPEGFMVTDPSRQNKDLDTITYKRRAPDILLEEEWTALDAQSAVLARASGNAKVLTINEGTPPGRKPMRFAVCLACGFSKLMPENPDADKNWRQHWPVTRTLPKFVTDSGCTGGSKDSYLFQENVSLASEWQTDCLQAAFLAPRNLFVPAGDEDADKYRRAHWRSAGTGIGVALRTAVAQYYGISDEEMSFACSLRRIGNATYLIVSVYDNAMAGYSSGAAKVLPELLRRAYEILQCPTNHCETACSACLLRFDTQKPGLELDRHDALKVLDSNGVPQIVQGKRINGLNTQALPVTSPLLEYLDAAFVCHDAAKIRLLVSEKPEADCAVGATDIYNLARQFGERHPVEPGEEPKLSLAAEGFKWRKLDPRVQNRLSCLTDFGICFEGLAAGINDLPGKDCLVAVSEDALGRQRGYWRLSEGSADNQKSGPWMIEGAGVRIVTALLDEKRSVRFEPQDAPQYEATDFEATSAVVRELSLTGCTVSQFGREVIAKALGALKEDAQSLSDIFTAAVSRVEYTDNYLERVGDPALVISLFSAVAESAEVAADASFVVRTGIPKNRAYRNGYGYPDQLFRFWGDEEIREKVFRALEKLAAVGSTAQGRKAMKLLFEVSEEQLTVHHRQLMIHFANGDALEILMDQGVGCVDFPRVTFHSDKAEDWARYLLRLACPQGNSRITVSDSKKHPTHLAVTRIGKTEH